MIKSPEIHWRSHRIIWRADWTKKASGFHRRLIFLVEVAQHHPVFYSSQISLIFPSKNLGRSVASKDRPRPHCQQGRDPGDASRGRLSGLWRGTQTTSRASPRGQHLQSRFSILHYSVVDGAVQVRFGSPIGTYRPKVLNLSGTVETRSKAKRNTALRQKKLKSYFYRSLPFRSEDRLRQLLMKKDFASLDLPIRVAWAPLYLLCGTEE